MKRIKVNGRFKKFIIVFMSLGMVTLLMVIQGSSTLERVALFLPLIATCIYWAWVFFDESYLSNK